MGGEIIRFYVFRNNYFVTFRLSPCRFISVNKYIFLYVFQPDKMLNEYEMRIMDIKTTEQKPLELL